MLTWLTNNLGTIIVALIMVVIVALIIMKLIKDRKAGKSSCGCECGNCPMAGKCHNKKD